MLSSDKGQGQLFCCRSLEAGNQFLLSMPSRVGASSPTSTSVWLVLQGRGCISPIEAANKEQDKLSGAQVTVASSTMPSHTPKFTPVLDINTAPGCGKTMGIDMALGITWAWISPWPWLAVQTTQSSVLPVTVWLREPTWPISLASTRSLMATWAMGINTEPGYNKVMNPDLVFSGSLP